MRVVLLALIVMSTTVGVSRGESKLPIITGNFSVNWIQKSPVGAHPDPNFDGEPVLPPENWAQYSKSGLAAYEDYVAWGAVEREPGKWDWSRQIEVADNQRAGALEYDPYLWIMNPPAWMREGRMPDDPDAPDHFTLMRCLEHGEETYTFSIWDPATVEWFERYYRECRRAMGDKIGRMYVGLVGPYGEGNYPLPMFDWLTIGHCHEGYWCGDAFARRHFQESARKRYRTVARLNTAWGTEFKAWQEIDFPPEIAEGKILKAEGRTDPKDRRRWIDFIDWYHQSLIDFSVDVTKAAARHFPLEKLKMKPGGSAGGVNPIAWGTYCPGYAKSAAQFGIRLQPADCHGRPFADRWYGTAYRFYGIPLSTESAGSISTRDFRARIFMDACNGATEMFTYEWDKHNADALKWIHLYRGMPSITDVAVYCPTTWYRMNGDLWPAIRIADGLRDITDFEVADELLISDDYLTKANVRMLIWIDGPVVEHSVLRKVLTWVSNGGILISRVSEPPVDVEGRGDIGRRLFSNQSVRRVGKGLVVSGTENFADLVKRAVYHAEEFDPELSSVPEIDTKADGVWTAVFPDRLLFMNTSDKAADIRALWGNQNVRLQLPAHELAEVLSEDSP